ncbi:3-hydroxyacyl-CoA dehydrogenase family protein [bacterium]|nr:3-hydroxyacyl-CoA dehydrogenase family protein [bacterium]
MKKLLYKCNKCKKTSHYHSNKCFYCGGDVSTEEITQFEVVGKVEVKIPSKDHEQVPYFDLLISDKEGNYYIEKTSKEYEIGEFIENKKEDALFEKLTIGVIGSGQMGSGLVQVLLLAGHNVILTRRKLELLNEAKEAIKNALLKNKSVEEVESILENLSLSTTMNDFGKADIIIESASEDIEVKHKIFSDVSKIANDKAIFCTNTSSILIKDVFKNVERKDKVAGLHFFNPVPRMALVEVVLTQETSDITKSKLFDLAKSINKVPIAVKDSPCFIVNRAMVPFINEAIEIYTENVALPEDIDKSIVLGLNHPIGPLALIDLIGLDIFVAITENLYSYKKQDKYKANKILYTMIKENKLGRKTGEGFYSYKKEK